MSHLDKGAPCARCESPDDPQYDNTLGDCMCKSCWSVFFATHEYCRYCNETVLMPELEEAWENPEYNMVLCLSAELGHRGPKGVLCTDCLEWHVEQKLKRVYLEAA